MHRFAVRYGTFLCILKVKNRCYLKPVFCICHCQGRHLDLGEGSFHYLEAIQSSSR